MTIEGSTLQDPTRGSTRPDQVRPRPQLYLVLESAEPFAFPARFGLAGLETVAIGRGRGRRVTRESSTLDVRVSDPWMSSAHAVFEKGLGRWSVRDDGSRNGIVINGERVQEAPLVDGDLIELGHTFFLYRDAVPTSADDAVDLEVQPLRAELRGLDTLSPVLARQLRLVGNLAASDVPIIIHGESGTGKEVIAQAVHAISRRRGRFTAVNCGAIPANLVEAELFGARKGAFTGATEDRLGLVRSADGGTLFLDEIADLPAASQSAFLRVLQEREVVPVGETEPVPVDVRVIAASHARLDDMLAEGTFRSDLYARLTGYTVELPALRERREDMGILIAALLAILARDATEPVRFTQEAARRLLAHDWPLNIRELEKTLQTALVLANGGPIDIDHLPQIPATATAPRAKSEPAPLDAEEEARRVQLESLLSEHDGNIAAVARAMGKDRKQIRRWIERYGITRWPTKT